MIRLSIARALALASLLSPLSVARGVDLSGSPASMIHQHAVAVQEEYTFLRTPLDVRKLAAGGRLVEVTGNEHYSLSGVSFPYARPEVLSFIEHFAAEYQDSTGARLIVTSLTRPEALQPRNAHALSVHPAGMAVDLRIPPAAAARAWLERALLGMEQRGLLDVTRERAPAHYHIAVFAEEYVPYAARLDSLTSVRRAAELARRSVAERVAMTPPPPASDRRLPGGVLLGCIALIGVTTPTLRRAHRRRRNGRGEDQSDRRAPGA